MPAAGPTRGRHCWISSAREESGQRPQGQGAEGRGGGEAPGRREQARAEGLGAPLCRAGLARQSGFDRTGNTGLAATDAERLIRLSSIRVELQNGRKQGRYESRDGRWSLAASASAAAGEDGSSGAPPEVEPERDEATGVDRRTGIAGSPIPGVGSRRKREQGKARPDLLRRSRSTGDGPARDYFSRTFESDTWPGTGAARPAPPPVSLPEVPSVHTRNVRCRSKMRPN